MWLARAKAAAAIVRYREISNTVPSLALPPLCVAQVTVLIHRRNADWEPAIRSALKGVKRAVSPVGRMGGARAQTECSKSDKNEFAAKAVHRNILFLTNCGKTGLRR